MNKIYTVSELNSTLKKLISLEFSAPIWVCGEIQDYRLARDKKHIYFNLVQKHLVANEIVARVRVALFFNVKQFVFAKLQSADRGFTLKDDLEIKLLCRVDLHVQSGQYSLIVVDVDPLYTLGKVAAARQQIIEELREKGYFDKNAKLPLSLVPLKIGLITAIDSAAYHDFINELKSYGYAFQVKVINAHMQGKQVENDLVEGIKYFSENEKDAVDLVVITRGGGAIADLSWFDSRLIAQAIADASVPVITALGHEINLTIADMLAHTALKTPTKAAQFLGEKIKEYAQVRDSLAVEMLESVDKIIDFCKRDLKTIFFQFNSLLSRCFRIYQEGIAIYQYKIAHHLDALFLQEKRNLKTLEKEIPIYAKKNLQTFKEKINTLDSSLKLLSPKVILKRGYSITYCGNKVVKSAKEVKQGDLIKNIFYDGEVASVVNDKG